MKKTIATIAIISALTLVGCSPEPDTALTIAPPNQGTRFTVERVGVIEDDLAYNNRRGIYVLTDRQTDKQYVGMSGVGISELGSHAQSNGKATTRVQDER